MAKPTLIKPSTRSSKRVAARPSGQPTRETDVVLSMLKKMNLPVTLESYVNLAYLGKKKPRDLTAEEKSELPLELQEE